MKRHLFGRGTLLALSLFAAAGAWAQDAPDRSGLADLVKLSETYSAMRNTRFFIARYDLQDQFDRSPADYTTELWFAEPGKFRLTSYEAMGGGFLAVADGKTLMVDELQERFPIRMREAKKTFTDSGNEFGLGRNGSYILTLLDGPDAIKGAFREDAAITTEKSGSLVIITVKNNNVTITFRAAEAGGKMTLQSVETASRSVNNMGDASNLRRDVLVETATGEKWDASLLEAKAPEGMQVVDERTAAGRAQRGALDRMIEEMLREREEGEGSEDGKTR